MPNISGEKSKKDFVGEAEDILGELHRNLEELEETYEQGYNPDTLNAIFRGVHSLKGLSGVFGLKKTTELSHRLESFLDSLRLGKIEVNRDALDLIFESLDVVKRLIEDVGKEEEITDTEDILSKINSFMVSEGRRPEPSPLDLLDIEPAILRVLTEYEEHRLKACLKEGKRIFLIKASFDLQSFDKGLEDLNKDVKAIGELITTLPSKGPSVEHGIQFTLLVGSREDLEGMRERLKGSKATVEEVHLKRDLKKGIEERKTFAIETSLKSASKTVRVDIGRLDRLMNTVGELVLSKAALGRISKELIDAQGYSPFVADLQRVSQSLDRRLMALQNEIIEVRMVPVGQIFSRLSQIVRRYSREIGKEIDLEFYGEDTELDKFLAEEIADPLMHIIRNAMDHGIEPPHLRKGIGKKERGTVRLRAFPRGNHVVITIEDDGAGIDHERILKKAIEEGLVEKDAILDKREILELLFLPGLTIKTDVSEVSGRGMGMNIVKTKISQLSGFIDIDTDLGRGTTFTVTLPITLAIIKALIVGVGKEIFAIPLTSVSESLMIGVDAVQSIEKREVVELRGEMLPLMRLDRVFEIPKREGAENLYVVVVGLGERRIGFVVDELIGQQEIVIKSLGESLKGLQGISGAAELGKYQVILVLDVESLIEEAIGRRKI